MPSAYKRSSDRRRVMAGYPIEEPFQSILEVRHYLKGDRITCLLCGKDYRKLGIHLRTIHEMTVDDYKERYKIPWSYGLLCSDSSKLYSNHMHRRMEDGFTPPCKFGDEHKEMISVEKRKSPFKAEVAMQNLGEHTDPKHPLTVSPTGELETFTTRRERETSSKGTKEFHEKMKARPQCQPEVVGKRLGDYWRGKKQSPEHVAKRFANKRRDV
jgi:hypothetical protein